MREKYIAQLVIRNLNKLSVKQREGLATWLKKQAYELTHADKKVGRRYTTTFDHEN